MILSDLCGDQDTKVKANDNGSCLCIIFTDAINKSNWHKENNSNGIFFAFDGVKSVRCAKEDRNDTTKSDFDSNQCPAGSLSL